jgi:MoxR-vWA-beta-propeller ternary system domain bpX4
LNESEINPPSVSPVAGFLCELFAAGVVNVDPFVRAETTLPADAAGFLRDRDELVRAELADGAPALDRAAADWAALQFYHACQFFADRDPVEALVRQVLAVPCPGGPSAERDYSVDLVFRFLPDLIALAEQRAPGDALTAILREWARAWPLSSVGYVIPADVPGVGEGAFMDNVALRRLYLDRIFARSAKDRLADSRVRRQIAADAGPHSELLARLSVDMGQTPATRLAENASGASLLSP